MPTEYTDVEIAFLEAADGRYTAAEVAKSLGRPESGVYQAGRRLGITFKPKPVGSLELPSRGAFNIPEDDLPHYQQIVNRIGERFDLMSKTKVFLKSLDLADQWLEDEENQDDTVRTDRETEQQPQGLRLGRDDGMHPRAPERPGVGCCQTEAVPG